MSILMTLFLGPLVLLLGFLFAGLVMATMGFSLIALGDKLVKWAEDEEKEEA